MEQSSRDDRLHRLLGGPHTTWLVERMRRRLELGKPLTGSVTLFSVSAEQRRAVELLLGRRPGGGASLSVSLDELDRTLRASRAAPDGLAAAVEQLAGPIRNRSAEAASVAAAWASAFRELDATVADRPELIEWRAWLDTTGVVRRLVADPSAARLVLDAVAGVVQRLPSTGVPLGRLAAEVCGDAHALDEGRPVATLALSAARAMTSDSSLGEALTGRREIWAAVGVHLDELSSTVLCLGLPGESRTPLGLTLAAMRAVGEPSVLTLRQLRRHDGPVLAPQGLVRLCENPVVVAAAAEELGAACPPLVCVNGRPSAAVWRLLDLLASGGARFAYHGDFDWGGVAIAAAVYERVRWEPWRFDAAAYESAAGSSPLSGTPLPTPWDPALQSAMVRRGVRIEEELAIDDLLRDLAR
ncbi:TIGR02679 family protein [Jiangella alkaliphila]|uniref:TIGR02679 family protein n=1 Tax=Jiangella alkaliphila TaxID=419479 RepID=A0A1H2IX86_9ACTN|nr:TIGR02679 family protein [Jiangella alkaliphila]SDU48486.1 TIGR02679 family protein [Jiangella alkaliphila]